MGYRVRPATHLNLMAFWSRPVRVSRRTHNSMRPSPIANRPTWSTYYQRVHRKIPNSARERARRRGKKNTHASISLIIIGMTRSLDLSPTVGSGAQSRSAEERDGTVRNGRKTRSRDGGSKTKEFFRVEAFFTQLRQTVPQYPNPHPSVSYI